jgi:hypothetical protein
MTSRRPLAVAVVSAATLAPAASAQAPQPTIAFDRPCYTAQQALAFTGVGYTPSGPVRLLFSVPGEPRAGFGGAADPSGGIAGQLGVAEDTLLARDEDRRDLTVTATDQTRADAGAQPPESQFGTTQPTFTRWAGFSPGRYVPGRKVEVEAFGWAFAAGKPLHLLFQKGRSTVASVRAGRLSADCGDLVARVRVPRKLAPGAYRLVLANQKRSPSGLYTWRKGHVAKRAPASAAGATAPMRRVG